MITKKEQKKFLRILKEIGLYTQWVKNRRKSKHKESIIPDAANGNFGHDVSSSFIFSSCTCTDMWYAVANSFYATKYDEILICKEFITSLKLLIEKYTNKNEQG
jgi:hypothetical protein